MHDAVDVLYKCKKCGLNFHCTYEVSSDNKNQRWGFYKEVVETNFIIETTQICYEELGQIFQVNFLKKGREIKNKNF